MAKHQWSVLCRRTIIDKDDNSVSLIDELEEVTVFGPYTNYAGDQSPPPPEKSRGASPFGFQLVSLWIRNDRQEPETQEVRVLVKNPKGKTIHEVGYEVSLAGTSRSRHILRFGSLPFDGVGVYQYLTQKRMGKGKEKRWKTVSTLYLDVKAAEGVS